jgi:hypothetical protein
VERFRLVDPRISSPPFPPPEVDARTHALSAFREFVSTLLFRRRGIAPDFAPIDMRVPKDRIFIEQPDNVVELEFPAIAFLPGTGNYEWWGLGGSQVDDSSLGRYAPGTVIVSPATYVETFVIEAWASKPGERRAIFAGLESAMLLFQDVTTLRMRLPGYFDRTAVFALADRTLIDDPDAVRNRRRGHLSVQLSVPMAFLANAKTLQPFVHVNVVASASLD